MKDKICTTLGKNIKKYRKLRNLTQEKMAELVEVEVRTLSLIETGNNFVSSKTLLKISEILEVSPSDLLEEISNDKTQQYYQDIQKALELIKDNPAKIKALRYIMNGML